MQFDDLEPRRLLSAFYVSTSGSDSAVGTATAPWRTLQHAADTVPRGRFRHRAPGNYTGFHMETSGTLVEAHHIPR